MSTIGSLLQDAAARLASRGIASAHLDADLLLGGVLGLTRASLLARRDETVSGEAAAKYEGLLLRREARVPVAYLVGVKEFWSLDFEVNASVLIPRPETELIVEEGLRLLASRPPGAAPPLAADVGTGAGPIAIALARERRDLTVHATDVSGEALAVAGRNAQRHGVASSVRFHQGDLLSPLLAADLAGRFDIVASNPPYVGYSEEVEEDVLRWEPRDAVFAGAEGGEVIERLIPQAARALLPGGHLVMEIGPAREAFVRRQLASGAGSLFWSGVRVLADLAGRARAVCARRSEIGA